MILVAIFYLTGLKNLHLKKKIKLSSVNNGFYKYSKNRFNSLQSFYFFLRYEV